MTDHPDQHSDLSVDYEAKAAAVASLTKTASAEEWARPSPCEGWTASDVLAHLIDTQRDFLVEQHLDPGPGVAGGDPSLRWKEHAAYVAGLLNDSQIAGRTYGGYFGPTTIGDTMAQFYGWDMLCHRYDLGTAMGRDPELTDSELTEIEAALPMFGEALRAPGICGPEIDVEADASRLVQVMALLGRDAR